MENPFKKRNPVEEFEKDGNVILYRPIAGSMRDEEIKKIIELSERENLEVRMNFNGIEIQVNEDSSPDIVELFYNFAQEVGLKKIGPDFLIPTDPEKLRRYADYVEQAKEENEKRWEENERKNKEKEERLEKIKEIIDNEEIQLAEGVDLDEQYEKAKNSLYGSRIMDDAIAYMKYMQVKMKENNSILTKEIMDTALNELEQSHSGGSEHTLRSIVASIWKNREEFVNIFNNSNNKE